MARIIFFKIQIRVIQLAMAKKTDPNHKKEKTK